MCRSVDPQCQVMWREPPSALALILDSRSGRRARLARARSKAKAASQGGKAPPACAVLQSPLDFLSFPNHFSAKLVLLAFVVARGLPLEPYMTTGLALA